MGRLVDLASPGIRVLLLKLHLGSKTLGDVSCVSHQIWCHVDETPPLKTHRTLKKLTNDLLAVSPHGLSSLTHVLFRFSQCISIASWQ